MNANACQIVHKSARRVSMSHVTRHTSHLTPHTSNLSCHTEHAINHMQFIVHQTSQVSHQSHVTRHKSHVTLHTSQVTRHTSYNLPLIFHIRNIPQLQGKTRYIIRGQIKPQTDASTKDPQISDHHKRRVEFWLSEVGVDGY